MTDRPKRYQTFFADLKRRHVFKVAAVYGAIAFAVMQAADFLVPALRLPDGVATGIALVAILGFPLALVLAWAFDLTPEGVRRTDRATSGELSAIVAEPASRRWPIGIFALAGIALLGVGVWWSLERGTAAPSAAGPVASSIAVLPFLNLSADSANEYFSDGVTEEIIAALSRLRDLRVVSRSATFRYKGTAVDPREVGRELGVATILEGSVRKEGDQVRITAQLIDVADGFHIWSQNYDRRYADIFEVQDEVARRITEALQLNLTEGEAASLARRPTDNLKAYELYSRARHEFYKYTPEGNASALELYQQALAIDQDYALALAGLSMCETQYINASWSQDLVWLDRAEASARRALEIDPQLAEAHFALGFVYEQRSAFEPMAEQMRRVLALNPNHAHAHDSQADVLQRYRGQLEAALEEYEVALRLDPFLLPARLNRAVVNAYRGRFAQAERELRALMQAHPDVGLVHVFRGDVFLIRGRYRDAVESYRRALELLPNAHDVRAGLIAALIELGELSPAQSEADRLAGTSDRSATADAARAYALGKLALARGQSDEALRLLTKAATADQTRPRGGPSDREGLADAFMTAGQPAEAARVLAEAVEVEPFRKYLYYKLGRALEASGASARAAAAYRQFLDDWRDADPDAPFVKDARGRLAALTEAQGVGARATVAPLQIVSASWDCANRSRDAIGSDLWPITWSDDDNQYTAWGDGKGFQGSTKKSWGIAKLAGAATSYTATDLAEGPDGGGAGKIGSIISVNGVLYLWFGDQAATPTLGLRKSTDKGQTVQAGFIWTTTGDIPGWNLRFVQHGKDNVDGDGYVYFTSYDGPDGVDNPIYLARVPEGQIEAKSAIKWFTSTNPYEPSWGARADRQAVITEHYGGNDTYTGQNVVTYYPPTKEYILTGTRNSDNMGELFIYAAPKPWGPWTSVYDGTNWCAFSDTNDNIGVHPAPKWIAGVDFWIVWSGTDTADGWDSFNLIQGTFTLG